MSQLNKWMTKSKISKLVIVITSKETGEHVERWQFDVRDVSHRIDRLLTLKGPNIRQGFQEHHHSENSRQRECFTSVRTALLQTRAVPDSSSRQTEAVVEKSEQEIQQEIQSIFRQITASVTFLPMLDGNCTFNVLVYADADSDVPLEWGDSDAKEIKNGEKVQLRSFSTNSHKVDTLVSYRYVQLWR